MSIELNLVVDVKKTKKFHNRQREHFGSISPDRIRCLKSVRNLRGSEEVRNTACCLEKSIAKSIFFLGLKHEHKLQICMFGSSQISRLKPIWATWLTF